METSNNYYLVLEFADGGEFIKYLCEKRKLSERECRKYIRQLVSAVDYMHRVDVIHRDIKVENFLLDEDMNLKVIDFGLSNMLGPDGLLHTQCGSPSYAAPEIFCNSNYGPAVDVWSIGVNMFAMLTGELPFVVDPPNNMTKLHARILQGCNIPVHLTKDCQDLLGKLMQINAKDRITIQEIMKHPWINRGYSHHLNPSSLPAKSHEVVQFDFDDKILSSLKNCGYVEEDVKETVKANKPLAENASYHLIIKRLSNGWGYPENNASSNSCMESIARQSPRSTDSPESFMSPTRPSGRMTIRPFSGKTKQPTNERGNVQVSEISRSEQARRLKSPVVGDDFEESRMGPSTLSVTVRIVKSSSKESIFEDMKRTLEQSMVNLDINNNVSDQNDSIELVFPELPRDSDIRLSTHTKTTAQKAVSFACDRKEKTGVLSAVYLPGKPAAEWKENKKANAVSTKNTSKGTRLFYKRSADERKPSVTCNNSGCIVIVNGKLADQGDTKPRTASRADVPDRIGNALRNGMKVDLVPLKRTAKYERPHTQGSVDMGRSKNLPLDFVLSPYAGKGFPQHKLGLYYSTSGRYSKSVTYAAISPKHTTSVTHGCERTAGNGHNRHKRSLTAPSAAKVQHGAWTRQLRTAPSGYQGYRGLTNRERPYNSDSGLPYIFASSFKNE